MSRGKAMLRVPTISGTRKTATASITGTANRNIMSEPCMVKTML